MSLTTPKKCDTPSKMSYNYVYDDMNQVTYYFDDGAKGTQSKKTSNEYDGTRGSEDRMRYFDDD